MFGGFEITRMPLHSWLVREKVVHECSQIWQIMHFEQTDRARGWAQVVRLSSQDVPTAYAYELEAATIVQPEQVVEAVQRVVSGITVPA
jgi:pyruvate/2-oxoglutarate/acetoin dehydrogenase E1 component